MFSHLDKTKREEEKIFLSLFVSGLPCLHAALKAQHPADGSGHGDDDFQYHFPGVALGRIRFTHHAYG
jgi:hypothetical protein